MSFKKLHPQLVENLQLENITAVNENQKEVFRFIREGKNLFIKGEEGSGKTFLTALTTLMRVPEPQEGSPRAVILCASSEKAIEMDELIKLWGKRMDLTVDLAHDRGKQLQQRNDIFDGTEIVVGTTKRIYDLYIQNGLNFNMLKLFVIEDAQEVFRGPNPGFIIRMMESLPKCQMILNGLNKTEKIERFIGEVPFAVKTVNI